jgi:hypothetical protein
MVLSIVGLRPAPIIGMDLEVEFGAVIVPFLGVPAIAFVVADDRCRGAGVRAMMPRAVSVALARYRIVISLKFAV